MRQASTRRRPGGVEQQSRRNRYLIDSNAEWPQRVLYRACNRRRRGHVATFTGPLGAVRVQRTGRKLLGQLDGRHLVHTRQQIIHEAGAEKLTIPVVRELLVER